MREFLKNKRIISTITIAVLFLFLLYASFMFINAFFGALILFVISRPFYNWLRRRKFRKSAAASAVVVISLIIIILPLFFLVQGITDQIVTIPQTVRNLDSAINTINEYLPFEIQIDKDKIIQQIVPFFQKVLSPLFADIISTTANFVLFYFLLYYMLVNDRAFMRKIRNLMPFTEKNRSKVITKFGEITKSTIIGSLLIALIQGGMLALGFHVLGISGALFWGFVTALLSFIPIIGSPLVWGPATIFLLMDGDITKALILLAWGIIITFVDNVVRPVTNKKFGRIHPLISIIGIFIGLTQFGVIGIFIGPLLVAYFLLIWEIYKEEQLDSKA
jgi:predicted PurR-regulated permease PerM